MINDIPHKVFLLLLDLKFKEAEEEKNINKTFPKYDEPLQDAVSKIVWFETHSRIIKDFINLYNRISNDIEYNEKEIKYKPEEPQLLLVNKLFHFIIKYF